MRYSTQRHAAIAALALLLGACGGGTGVQPTGADADSDSDSPPMRASYLLGAWNVHSFGAALMADPGQVAVVVDVVRRFDLVIIQEVRDRDELAIHALLAQINARGGEQYGLILSPRLGDNSRYMEQYAYLYRLGSAALIDQFNYDDGPEPDGDSLAREPLVTYWDLGGFTLVLLPSHIAPENAPAELNALVEVAAVASDRWGDRDLMIIGDLNADCAYVGASDWPDILLRNDPAYVWLIDDDADTTVSATDCAYDRIIATAELAASAQLSAAGVFDYQLAYGLSDELAARVSDHFPVEVTLTSADP